jgi:hypothetical protein
VLPPFECQTYVSTRIGEQSKQREDVRVIQTPRDVYLTQEALAAQHCAEFRPQQLERHLPMMLEILGQVHDGHATATELLFYTVAVSEGSLEAVQQVGHGVTRAGTGVKLWLRN